MMKIAVLSDTHGLLRPEVIEIIKTCDVVFHSGDIDTEDLFNQLSALAPLYIVRGNNDKEWADQLPLTLRFQLDGIRFFMVHDKKDLPPDLSEIDVVIFGHSHQYKEERK
ncbi:MAG: metallophosphoesterase family protein, partial [Emergencia timonensis]